MRIDWPSCPQMEIDPPCAQCAAGSYMLCENLGAGSLPLRDVGGGFSPFMVMHRAQPFAIPDAISPDRALLLEPTASALHGVLKAEVAPGDNVLVIGAGTIGLLTVAIAARYFPETKIHCLARYPFQAELARRLGAHEIISGDDLYGRVAAATGARSAKGVLGNQILLGGFDVVYDTVGGDRTLGDALRWIKGGGQLVILGINFKPGKIDYSPIWAQEIRVTGINCHGTEADGETSFTKAAKLLAEPDFGVEALITHRFPVGRYKEAVKTFMNKRGTKAVKIILDHEPS
jgi:threonine dehydrogenase-like Zn-dependent dehydrogenase